MYQFIDFTTVYWQTQKYFKTSMLFAGATAY